jgi:hypothetical protein
LRPDVVRLYEWDTMRPIDADGTYRDGSPRAPLLLSSTSISRPLPHLIAGTRFQTVQSAGASISALRSLAPVSVRSPRL